MSRLPRWLPLVAAVALVAAPAALACEQTAAMAPACPMVAAMQGGACHSAAAETMNCCLDRSPNEPGTGLIEGPRPLGSMAETAAPAALVAASPPAALEAQFPRLHDPPLYYRVSSLLL